MKTEIIEADIVKWLAGNQWLFENGYLPKYHAVFCDPPYFLGSIVKRFGAKNAAPAKHGKDGAFVRASKGFMGKTWDGFESMEDYQAWVTTWATLLLSVVYPGAIGLFFGGTRTYHRLAAGLEDAGWEIVDSFAYIYGSGFPKSHSVSDTHGTALKPAYEPVLVVRKPLTSVPSDIIITELNMLIGGMLWLLLWSANDVENLLQFSPKDLPMDGMCVSVATLVALLNKLNSGELSEKMDMFNSPGMVSTCLNIALLWNNILADAYSNGSKYTTSTETGLITALKICKSLILAITPVSITSDVIKLLGLPFDVINAEKNLTEEEKNTSDTQKHFAAANVTLKTALTNCSANGVVSVLQAVAQNVSIVLESALTELPITSEESKPSSFLPCIVARAPRGNYTFLQLSEKFGSGAFNIDGARISTSEYLVRPPIARDDNEVFGKGLGLGVQENPLGRWPSNLLLSHSEDCTDTACTKNCPVRELNSMSGDTASPKETVNGGKFNVQPGANGTMGNGWNGDRVIQGYGDSGGSARFFYTAKASTWEREVGLDELTTKPFGASNQAQAEIKRGNTENLDDATFGIGQIKQLRNNHPTLKPISITEYLSHLLLPPPLSTPRRILIPFAGSGSEMIGAQLAGWDDITGVEREHEYVTIASARLKWWSQFKTYEAARKTKEIEIPAELTLPDGSKLKQMEMSL